MRAYKPAVPFATCMKLLTPEYQTVKGVRKPVYPDPAEVGKKKKFWGTFRSFGGTESMENDIYTVIATGYIDTWYRSDIRPDCRIHICESSATYEILGEPEDINMRHQYMKIRVRKVGGRA